MNEPVVPDVTDATAGRDRLLTERILAFFELADPKLLAAELEQLRRAALNVPEQLLIERNSSILSEHPKILLWMILKYVQVLESRLVHSPQRPKPKRQRPDGKEKPAVINHRFDPYSR